ncbi:hypothetical protein [Actinokineospora sp. NPDC004072]
MSADPGSRLAEELSLLFAAVAEQAGPWLDRVAANDHDSAACEWCPLCGVIALLRGEPSVLAAQSLERMADLVALLRAVLADRWAPEEAPHMPGFTPPPKPPPASGRVQRIPVRRT